MNLFVLTLGLLAALALAAAAVVAVGAFARHRRLSRAHTEARTGVRPAPRLVSPPMPPPPPPPVPPRSVVEARPPAVVGPVTVMMTYTKADGSTRERELTLYSRNLREGRTYSLNAREPGNTVTKQFLLSGISRIVVPADNSPCSFTDPDSIVSWLEQAIPLKGAAPPKRTTSSPDSTAPTVPPLAESTPAQSAPVRSSGFELSDLLPVGARGFAVLDLETTGLGRNCRIVEIALVRLDPMGHITEEWETLVSPGVLIPNADVHGIDDALVQLAPSFEDIAGLLAAKLHEHVVVAHNLRGFDGPILEAHFASVDGVDLHLGDGLDTMPTPRIKLVDLCARHGVVLESGDAHTALGDTRALAKALKNGMAHLKPAQTAVVVRRNDRLSHSTANLTRAMVAAAKPPVDSTNNWQKHSIQLEPGLVFMTTGPASMKADTEIKRAELHVTSLGLEYRKVSSIPKRNPPAFLLTTSLGLSTRKMQDARELGVPVVLCRDVMRARQGTRVQSWLHSSSTGAAGPS